MWGVVLPKYRANLMCDEACWGHTLAGRVGMEVRVRTLV